MDLAAFGSQVPTQHVVLGVKRGCLKLKGPWPEACIFIDFTYVISFLCTVHIIWYLYIFSICLRHICFVHCKCCKLVCARWMFECKQWKCSFFAVFVIGRNLVRNSCAKQWNNNRFSQQWWQMVLFYSQGILAHLLRMVMEPKYLAFRRWLYTPCSSSDVRWARIPRDFWSEELNQKKIWDRLGDPTLDLMMSINPKVVATQRFF